MAMKYVTRLDRFTVSDFPLVCVHSGRPAAKMIPVRARPSPLWPWVFLFTLPALTFLLLFWIGGRNGHWGMLPHAEGEVGSVKVVYEKRIGVILRGVHPDFVAATRTRQGKSP